MRATGRRIWTSPTITSWGSLAIRLASVVVLLPLVLVRFAPSEVAVWQLFSALFLLGMMLDFGLAPTFIRLLSYARAGMSIESMGRVGAAPSRGLEGKPEESAAEIFSTMRWLYVRMALLVTVVMLVLGTLALQTPIRQVPDPSGAWVAWGLVVVTLLLFLAGASFGAALQGMNLIAEMRRWEIAFGCLQMVSSVAVIWFGGGLLELVAAYQFWALVAVARNRWLLKARHPELFKAPGASSQRVMAVAYAPASRNVVGVVSSLGVIQLSGVLYSQAAPADAVAAYLLALRLISVVSAFSQAPFYSKIPSLAQLHAAGRPEAVLKTAARGMTIAHWVFVAGALLAAFGAPLALQVIGSKTGFVSPLVFAMLALAFFVERFGAMHIQLYSLTNHVVIHIANGVTGVVVCLLSLWWLTSAGLLAFPAAMLAGYVFFYCPYAVVHSVRAFAIRWPRFELKISVLPLSVLLLGLGLGLAAARSK
jgi:hypothetical protein